MTDIEKTNEEIQQEPLAENASAVEETPTASTEETAVAEPVATEAREPVVADVTDRRDFIITLYPEYAPITCENFEKLVLVII